MSNIIMGDQRGANIGAGLDRGSAAVAQAMIQRAQERKQKEEEKAMADYLDPLLQRMSNGQVTAKDAPKGTLPFLYQQAKDMETQQSEAPLRKLEYENAQLKQLIAQKQFGQQQTDADALKQAMAPRPNDQYAAQLGYLLRNPPPTTRDPTSREILKSYIGSGGAINRDVVTAAQLQEPPPPAFSPKVVDAGGGVQALMTSPRSAIPVPRPKDAAPNTFTAGGKSYIVGPGNRYFDAQGNPVVFPTSSDQATVDAIESFGKKGSAPAANDLPSPKSKAERDALPHGTRYLGTDGQPYTRR